MGWMDWLFNSRASENSAPLQMAQETCAKLSKVNMPEAPLEVVQKGEQSCPFDSTKKIKETHVLVYIPSGLSVKSLFNACGKSTDYLCPSDSDSVDNSYWCYVYKKPYGKHTPSKMLRDRIAKFDHEFPRLLELCVAIFVAKDQNVTLFDGERNAVLADKTAIGGDRACTFSTYATAYAEFGTAPVIRIKSKKMQLGS